MHMKIPSNNIISGLNQDRYPFPDFKKMKGRLREIRIKTHAKFTIDNVDEAAGDYDEIEGIPSIRKIILVIPKLGVVVC